jgi:predicted RNase H-like nuclease (RuvC/YqgF family)
MNKREADFNRININDDEKYIQWLKDRIKEYEQGHDNLHTKIKELEQEKMNLICTVANQAQKIGEQKYNDKRIEKLEQENKELKENQKRLSSCMECVDDLRGCGGCADEKELVSIIKTFKDWEYAYKDIDKNYITKDKVIEIIEDYNMGKFMTKARLINQVKEL